MTLGEPVPKRYTENPRAYNLYLRGRFAWNLRSAEGMRAGDRLLRAGDRRGCRIRPGLERAGGRLRDRGGLPERPGRARDSSGQGAGAARHRTRRRAGRGAHLACLGHLHPRLGLGRGGARVPPRHRRQPELRVGAPMVCLAARITGAAGRGRCARESAPSSSTRRRSRCGAGWVGCTSTRATSAGDRAHAPGARHESHGAGDRCWCSRWRSTRRVGRPRRRRRCATG